MALKPMSPATILAYAHADAKRPINDERLRHLSAYAKSEPRQIAAELLEARACIAALEAENALLRVAAGPLVVAALETAAKPEMRECCAFCGAAPRNPCDYAYPHPQAKTVVKP